MEKHIVEVQVFEGDGKMNPEWEALLDLNSRLSSENKALNRKIVEQQKDLARVREEARKRIKALKEGKPDEEIPELPSYSGTATNFFGPITVLT